MAPPVRTAGLLLTMGVLVGACGDDDQAADTSATSMVLVPDKVNDADLAFARSLRARAEVTADLAALGRERAGDQRVKDLAEVIHEAQRAQMAMIDEWLRDWDEPLDPSTSQAGGAEVLAGVETTPNGTAFDRALVEAMIVQLDGEVPIAQRELDSGTAISAVNLADRIVQEQPGEIEEMQGLLAELP